MFANPPALAQLVSLPSLPHHFSFPPALAESIIQSSFPSFPPAPARSWSEGLKQGLQLFITCPKLKLGFEAQFAIDHLSSYRPRNRWWRQRIWVSSIHNL